MANTKQTTLCYIIDDHKWLMLYRNKKEDDINFGKWIGVGGKVEEGETPKECVIREINEETGFNVKDVKYRGLVHFGFGDDIDEDMYVYTCHSFTGNLKECNEGEFAWIDEKDLFELNMWEGDKIFLNKLLEDSDEVFELELKYDTDYKLIYTEN